MKPIRVSIPAVLAVAAAILLAACGGGPPATTPSLPPASMAPDLPLVVSVADAAAMRDDGAFVLDVREPDEWAAGHIPGSTLIPLGQLSGRLSEVPADRGILVVCRTGHRAAQGRDILRQAGYDAAVSVTGGMTDWLAAGLPVVTGP